MTRRCFYPALAMTLILVAARTTQAATPEKEQRTFSVAVDGKRSGEYQMRLEQKEDGTITVTGKIDFRVKILVYTYSYSYQGTEVWKDGRLMRLDSTSNDDGTPFKVSAIADASTLRLKLNNTKEKAIRWDVWTTTYWRLPAAKWRNQTLPLLDADTGKELTARLQHIGTGPMSVLGQVQNCSHYRLTGGVQVDLWFDAQERLVRQEWTERGAHNVMELTQLRR